jgi:hypothetical protein
MTIRSVFCKFPKEAEIIGRLLAGYSSLELDLLHCAQVVRDDLDTVLKAMFRTRGETAPIRVADAFGRHAYAEHGLDTEFSMAIGAVQYCLQIRNQYAHCIWYDDNTKLLAFTNLEEIAAENTFIKDIRSLTIFHVDVALLEAQETYYRYTDNLLLWVNYEGRLRARKIKMQPIEKPKQLTPPFLHYP